VWRKNAQRLLPEVAYLLSPLVVCPADWRSRGVVRVQDDEAAAPRHSLRPEAVAPRRGALSAGKAPDAACTPAAARMEEAFLIVSGVQGLC
jgi:hypothetical protein